MNALSIQRLVQSNTVYDINQVGQNLAKVKAWLAIDVDRLQDDHKGYRKVTTEYSSTARWIFDESEMKDWKDAEIPAHPRKSFM